MTMERFQAAVVLLAAVAVGLVLADGALWLMELVTP